MMTCVFVIEPLSTNSKHCFFFLYSILLIRLKPTFQRMLGSSHRDAMNQQCAYSSFAEYYFVQFANRTPLFPRDRYLPLLNLTTTGNTRVPVPTVRLTTHLHSLAARPIPLTIFSFFHNCATEISLRHVEKRGIDSVFSLSPSSTGRW